MTGPGQSLSVTLSRCSLRPSEALWQRFTLLHAAAMRSSCTASGPANPRYGDRTRDLHGFSAAVLQHTSSGPLWQSRCALRSTMTAHADCPHTVLPGPHTMGPLCRALRACSAAASCAARVPAHGLSQVALRVASSVPARGPSHALKPLRADPPAHTRALCNCACSFC